MLKTVVSKVAWVGRTASMVFGLALVLALLFGVATMAMGANGNPFLLGKKNVASAISTLAKQGTGPALSLVVGANQPPLKVNASAGKATNLNADKLDGISSNELVRSGLGVTENGFPGISFTDRTTVTVNAPAKGFVLVNGTVVADTDSTSCNPCQAFALVRHDNSGQESVMEMSSLGNGTTNIHRDTLPMSWVFPVEAGTNTFKLRTGTFPDPAPVNVLNPTLTVLYVPFGSSGTSVLGASSMAASVSREATQKASDGVRFIK